MRLPFCTLLVAFAVQLAGAETVKPVYFGPYIVNELNYTGNPWSYRYALNNIIYHFQVSWIEPISESAEGIFRDTYFETDGAFNISPYQADVGTTFNLKPIRYLEMGLSYNRLIFLNSMAAYPPPPGPASESDQPVPQYILDKSLPGNVMDMDGEFGGADIFTFQANLTMGMGPLQLYLQGSRALWDVDAPGKKYVYEYSNDLVIKTRDRINVVLTKLNLDLSRYSKSKSYSFTGVALRNQYWHTTRTEQDKNLIAFGVTGFRIGRNPEGHRRGLDFSVGYWLEHPQLERDDWSRSISFLLEWKWNVRFLKM